MRILFTTQPGAGHWRPLAPLAWAMEAAGHEIAFATTPGHCPFIAEHGFRCFSVGTDDPDSLAGPDTAPLLVPEQSTSIWARLFAGTRAEQALPDLLEIGRSWSPDVIVREASEFGGCLAAEKLGIPHAAVQVSAYRPNLHATIAPVLNQHRELLGLPPDLDLDMLYRYLLLARMPPSFQEQKARLPSTAHFIRPVSFDSEHGVGLPDWLTRLPERPTVYATLGTAYNRTPGVLPAIIEGLRDEPVNLIATTGLLQDEADYGGQPENVWIVRYIPQSLLLPYCDLVITHGGYGTVMDALSHGLPLVVVPIAADQPDNARRCAELGVARVVAPDERSPEAIRDAARAVLEDARYRDAAEALQSDIETLPGPAYAVERWSDRRWSGARWWRAANRHARRDFPANVRIDRGGARSWPVWLRARLASLHSIWTAIERGLFRADPAIEGVGDLSEPEPGAGLHD